MDLPNAGPAAPLRKAVAGTTVHDKGVRPVGARPLSTIPIEYLLDVSSDYNSSHMGKYKGASYYAERDDGELVLAVAQGPERDDLWTFHAIAADIPDPAPPAPEAGFWNFSDTATAVTPINIPLGLIPVRVTNDALGVFSSIVYAPLGVGNIWDSALNQFILSAFNPRDVLQFRFNALVTTTLPDTRFIVNLVLGVGGFEYRINFIDSNRKAAGVYRADAMNMVFAGASPTDTNTINNPAYFEILADKACTCLVRSFTVSTLHHLV